MKTRLFAVSLLVLALPISASSEEVESRLELFAQAGPSFLTRGPQVSRIVLLQETTFSPAGRLAGGMRIYLTGREAIEFSASYSPNKSEITNWRLTPPSTVQTDAVIVHRRLVHGAVNYVRYLPARSQFEFFLTGGLGFAVLWGGTAGREALFVGNFGAGADVPLRDRIALRMEARNFLMREPALRHGLTNNFVPSVGLVFRLR